MREEENEQLHKHNSTEEYLATGSQLANFVDMRKRVTPSIYDVFDTKY